MIGDRSLTINSNPWASLNRVYPEGVAQRLSTFDNATTITSNAPVPDASTFLFSSCPPKQTDLAHPLPLQIFLLWQTFVDNVNPLSKVLHAPTVQVLILDATQNLETVPDDTIALMFAIYTAAVASMSDEDCNKKIGEARSSLLTKYSFATQQALAKARFLKSSTLHVLQAYVLYLVSWTVITILQYQLQCQLYLYF